jgi:hypothetical protein
MKTQKSSPYEHVGVVESAHHLILDRLRHLVHVPATENTPVINGSRFWMDKVKDAVALLNDRVIMLKVDSWFSVSVTHRYVV